MSPKDIEQLRYNILTNVAKMPALITFRNNNIPDYKSDIEHLKDLETVIEQIETIYKMDKRMILNVLGREFQANITPHTVPLAVPLYVYLDVIGETLIYAMNNTAKLDGRKQLLLARLKECRRKAAQLPHHPDFDPNKHISKIAIENMIASKGNYHFRRIVKNNNRYITIVSAIPRPSKDKRRNPYTYHEDMAFQEDYNQIKMQESEQYIKYIQGIQNHIKKYFVNDRIPDSTTSFHATLKDPHLDETIRVNLLAIVEQIDHDYTSDAAIPLDQAYAQLIVQEKAVQKQQVEQKASTFASQTLKEDNPSQRQGTFTRFLGEKTDIVKKPCTPEVIKSFEDERKKQILLDEEKRNIIICKREETYKQMKRLQHGIEGYRRY